MKRPWKAKMLAFGAGVAAAALLASCSAPSTSTDNEHILTVGVTADLSNTDPAIGINGSDFPFLYAIYDRLIDFDPSTLKPLPSAGLAASWGFTDSDNQVFRLTMKKNARFADGTRVDAQAVADSLKHFKDAKISSDLDLVDSIDVISDEVVELHLSAPYSVLPAILADRAGMIESPTALAKYGKNAGLHGAGAGEYTITSWNHGSQMTLKPNKYFHGDKPKLKGITFKVYAQAASLIAALKTGQVDFAANIDPTDATSLRGSANVKLVNEPTLGMRMIQTNATVAPMDDPLVRQALNIAIDRAQVVKAVFGKGSGAKVTNVPVPQGDWSYNPDVEIVSSASKAKDLLAQAGHPDGIDLTMCLFSADLTAAQEAAIYQTQWAKAGIRVTLDTQADAGACVAAMNAKKVDLLLIGWSGRPDPYLTFSQTTMQYTFGAKYPELTAEVAKIPTITDRDGQQAVYHRIDELWQTSVPQIMVYSNPNIVAYSTKLSGSAGNAQGKPNVTQLSFKD
jgi:ABC-type transport system substrate-binding protein